MSYKKISNNILTSYIYWSENYKHDQHDYKYQTMAKGIYQPDHKTCMNQKHDQKHITMLYKTYQEVHKP
jgi:hypothetical protein